MILQKILNRFYDKRLLFCAFLILSIVLFGLIVTNSFITTRELSRVHWTASVDMIDQRLHSIIGEINTFPRTAGNDISFLSSLSSIKEAKIESLEKDFLAFLLENTAYYRLSFIDGEKQIRVIAEFDGQDYMVTHKAPKDLYNFAWIEKMDRLTAGEVFISEIKIIIVQGQDVPIINYAAPVYTDDQKKLGLIVGSVYADYFLDDIRAAQREGELVFLVDNHGNYLAHPDSQREFGNLLGHNRNFQNDYSDIAKDILNFPEKRTITSNSQVFSTRAIYPTKGSFALYKAAEKIEKNSDNAYYWMLISVTDKKYLQSNVSDLINEAVIFVSLSLGVIIGIIGIGYVFAFRGKESGSIS